MITNIPKLVYSMSTLPAPPWCRKTGSPHTKYGSALVVSPDHNGYPETMTTLKPRASFKTVAIAIVSLLGRLHLLLLNIYSFALNDTLQFMHSRD